VPLASAWVAAALAEAAGLEQVHPTRPDRAACAEVEA